ncbi:MAG: hemin-degrading factor [Cellvibrionaceae bacterium]
MQLADYFSRPFQDTELRSSYKKFIALYPKTRQRDVAQALSVSEAALIDEQLGLQSIRLKTDFKALIEDLPKLGYIMNLTRNNYAVHERKGEYQNININGPMGLVIADDKKIDLRLFLSKWKHVYAVRENTKQGDRYSLQFFDQSGVAIQKIFLQEKSNFDHYRYLLESYVSDHQSESIVFVGKPSDIAIASTEVNAQQLVIDWQSMTDVHQFIHILKKHKVERQQAFRIVGSEYAEDFSPAELERILVSAAEMQLPIMCFVGNSGGIQIFSGKINKVKAMGPWLNILDPEFNLHLMETGIAEAWLVRKPTIDGIVTSLEFYDIDGNQVVQFFGQRQERHKENPLWTQLAESVLANNVPYKQSTVA